MPYKLNLKIYINTVFFFLQSIVLMILINKGIKNLFLIIFSSVIYLFFIYLESKYNFHINNYIRVLILLILLSHSFLGIYLNLYFKSVIFDNILHFLGIYSFTLLFYSLLFQIFSIQNSILFYNILFVIGLGIAVGTVFEIFEFLFDVLSNNLPRKQLGLIDTNLDLIFNVIGAIVAGIHLYMVKKP